MSTEQLDAGGSGRASRDLSWLEVSAARRKLLEMDALNQKFRQDLALHVLNLVGAGGLVGVSVALVMGHGGSFGGFEKFAGAAGFTGVFLLLVSLRQAATLIWECREVRRLRARLERAVDEVAAPAR